uniref:IQ motif and SEC7 domain-containing protein 2 n=1 Tax=Magallana gigas TaxID=29159 RepID=K1R3P6_MAGGI
MFLHRKPKKGIIFLCDHGFIGETPLEVAHFLITRKGLSKQMIGEYLGNLQNPFNQQVLEYFAQEIDLSGLQVDMALRKFQSHFRMPGEAQKIERLMEAFANRYCTCNPDQIKNFRTLDTIFLMAFAIIMLNTDSHNSSIKAERKMKVEDFIRNLRAIDDGQDVDRDMLIGIYNRIQTQEFRAGVDHVTQVMKVEQTVQIPLRLGWGTTIHRCQGMTIGEGEANRYIVIHPGDKKFEARNPGALFVALSRAKSAGGEDEDPDFAWHPHVLINEDRLCQKKMRHLVFATDSRGSKLKSYLEKEEPFDFHSDNIVIVRPGGKLSDIRELVKTKVDSIMRIDKLFTIWIFLAGAIDDGQDVDRDMLIGIYNRIQTQEFRAGVDHVTQVMKVEQTVVGKKPQLALPHRRLVCYCRLYEVHDPNKKEKIGLHQREVFLFNDLLLITKIFSKKKSGITFSYKQSFPLSSMQVFLFETSHYQYGVRLVSGVNNKVLITLNARNDHDRQKFVEDLREAILETNGMETLRIEEELQKHSNNHNTLDRHYANDDSRVLMYELMKPLDPSINRLSAPDCPALQKLPLSNSLTDLCQGTHAHDLLLLHF